MDNTIDFYRQCVKKILCEYEYLKDEDSQIELIFDDERMGYLVLWVGWYKYKRIHQCAVDVDTVRTFHGTSLLWSTDMKTAVNNYSFKFSNFLQGF